MRDLVRRRGATAVAIAVGCVAFTSCAQPSSDYGDFRAKVKQSAKDAQSAVATAQLMADEVLRGRTTLAYADTVVTDAENDVSAVQTAFDTRQPPDATSITLRDEFDNVLQDAVTAAQDLRIAVRRDDAHAIRDGLDEAAKAVAQLQRYSR